MRKNAGYTLIELSIALVVLGIVIMLIWRFVGINSDYATSNAERALLRSADHAVTGFVLSHNRLPCPDANGDGAEDCGTAAVGTLPTASIGLAQADAGRMRYGVYRKGSGTATLDADLAITLDRMPMLATTGTGMAMVGFDLVRSQRNGIDLCVGLRNGSANGLTPDTSMLHVVTPAGNVNVAYALALTGGTDADQAGSLLDAGNAAAGVAFEAPSRVTDGNYDDRVVAVGFDRLIGRINCSETLAAATHAHANAATMAEITRQAMADYKIQLDLIKTLADANVAGAAAGVAIAAAGLSASIAGTALATAEAIMSLGAASAITALAIAANVAAAAGVVSAALAVAPAAVALDGAIGNVNDFQDQAFVQRSIDLATQIRNNANDADAAGTY